MYDVIVVGGGAAGMMAAGRAASQGKRVLLLEKNKKLGEKLSITGGTRCNITNAEEDEHVLLSHYGKAEQFLYSSFAQFGMKDTFSFFEGLGLPLVVQANKRAFPVTEKATDVCRVLKDYLRVGKVDILTLAEVKDITWSKGTITGVNTDKGMFRASSYILATGGKSRPETGSTGDGFGWLKKLGHAVEEPTPTIVPIKVRDKWIKDLAGVSLNDSKITFYVDGKKEFSRTGTILCTHFGLSGPLILNSAGLVAELLQEGDVTAVVDLFPTLDLGALDTKLTELFDANKNKVIKNVLKFIAPEGTASVLLSLVPTIDPETKVHSITKEERKQIVHLLKELPITVSGLMGYDKAVVADGGLLLKEVDGKTMRSRLYDNLYVTGDLLHINRPSGGYSLQLCWTSGFVAGTHA